MVFFYPFEIQIADKANHIVNTDGEASHVDYKNAQLNAVIDRLKHHFETSLDLVVTAEENELFPVARELRDVPLTADDMRFVNGW